MGCLKKIIKISIIVLAIIGFVTIGGKDYFVGLWNNWFNPPQDVMQKRAKEVADFSKVSDEFKLDKATNAFGYNCVLAEHKSTGQKIIVLDSGIKPILTTKDFKDGKVDKKLTDLTKHFKYKVVSVDNFKITKRGTMTAFGNPAPYVRFNAVATHVPGGNVTGVISAVKTKSGKDRVLVSVNEKNKFSQLIAEDFFRNVK
ncbi:hypothetical protein KBA27_00940 [bacterium]|nr:hypothetical protein [bacterium]